MSSSTRPAPTIRSRVGTAISSRCAIRARPSISRGQGPVDSERNLVGEGEIEAQTRQAFKNLANKLEAAGATFADIVKMVVYVQDIEKNQWPVRNVRAEFIDVDHPPVSTMIEVTRLAKDGGLIEIDVIVVTA